MDICYAVLLVVGRKKSVKYMTTKSFILAPAVVLLCCTACSGTVEVIATHSGGPFSSITLSCDGESISSATVPPDGSLNTTNGGVTRVAFNDALSLARFVADRVSKPVTLSFSGRGSIKLSDRQKKMMSDVAALPTALKEVNELERNMPVIYNKIQVFRNKIEEKGGSDTVK